MVPSSPRTTKAVGAPPTVLSVPALRLKSLRGQHRKLSITSPPLLLPHIDDDVGNRPAIRSQMGEVGDGDDTMDLPRTLAR